MGQPERWQDGLAHVEQLRQIIADRTPIPRDGADLLDAELRRLLSAALLPDQAPTIADALSRGASAAAAAALAQRRWRAFDDEGAILLAWPDGTLHRFPVGDGGLDQPAWVKGFALAVIARDVEALRTLCTPESIAACELPAEVIDGFWPFYCGALAAAAVEPAAAPGWIADAELALMQVRIATPDLIELLIRPMLTLARALVLADAMAFNASLRTVIEAHRRYYSHPDRSYDWNGAIALPAAALAALAADRSIAITIVADYLPPELVLGQLTQVPSTVTYLYPLRSIGAADEAHWFLDLEGFPRAERFHSLVQRDDWLVARYTAYGAPGIPRARADFVLPDGQASLARMPPPALGPGDLLALAEIFARTAPNELGPAGARQQRVLLANAVGCVDTLLARIPPGQEAVDPTTLTSPRGRSLYDAEPGRFRRARLVAYRNALAAQLDAAPSEGSPSPTPQAEPDADARPDQAARAAAAIAIEAIRVQVLPILQAIAADPSRSVVAQLAPRAADFDKVFVAEIVDTARRVYGELWAQPLHVQRPTAAPMEIRCFVAPAGMLADENELSFPFPQGYRAIAHWLVPERVWVAWKYLAPGQPTGLAHNGLVWVDDHWAWFPKPYQMLRG